MGQKQEHQLGGCKNHHEKDRRWHGPEQQRWTGEKWWDWRYILKVELMEFGARLDVGCESKIKDDIPISWDGEDSRKRGFGEKGLGPIEMSIRLLMICWYL